MRLERDYHVNPYWLLLFQFHKGAIRTFLAINKLNKYCNFNSIKVRLEPSEAGTVLGLNPYFNSIKVRLEPNTHIEDFVAPKFQFHKGAIRTKDSVFDNNGEYRISIP